MSRLINAMFLLIFVCNLNVITGYKWETVKEGVELPKNAVRLGFSPMYVGRVVQYNLILPAKVVNSSYAVSFNAKTKTHIKTNEFEVLTASEQCKWKYLDRLNSWEDSEDLEDLAYIPENIVRVGRAWNREPIYLGGVAVGNSDYPNDIASILLSSLQFVSETSGNKFALVCVGNAVWVDATPPTIPNNAIVINKNNFVARLMGPNSLIPAYIRNDTYYCSTLFNGIEINSLTCQVLVGSSNSSEYSWQEPGHFERIPENAVVQGRTERNEPIYVSRDAFKSLALTTFSKVASIKYFYEVLVKNAV